MLVLSRRLNEKIHLPGLGITLQVVAIKQGVIRIGIEAPSDVAIFREEVLDRSQLTDAPRGSKAEWLRSRSKTAFTAAAC